MDRIDGWVGGGWMEAGLVTPIGIEFATTGSGAGGSGPTEKKGGGSPRHRGTPRERSRSLATLPLVIICRTSTAARPLPPSQWWASRGLGEAPPQE